MKITGNIRLPAQAEAALRMGNRIEAIKIVRQAYNIGLAEAKAVIDAFEAAGSSSAASTIASAAAAPEVMQNRTARPLPRASVPGYVKRDGLSPGEVPRGNNALQAVFFVAAILVAIVAYIKLG